MSEYKHYPKLEKSGPKNGFIDESGRWMVSPHLSYREVRCHCERPECAMVDWSQLIHPELVEFFEELRNEVAESFNHEIPLMVTSCCRCDAHQNWLITHNYPATRLSEHCPHFCGDGIYTLAMDITIPTLLTWPAFYSCVRRVDKNVRVGKEKYAYRFFHFGMGYLTDPNPKPNAWREGVEF